MYRRRGRLQTSSAQPLGARSRLSNRGSCVSAPTLAVKPTDADRAKSRTSFTAPQVTHAEAAKRVADGLVRHALFKGCSALLTDGIANQAPRKRLEAGEELDLVGENALFIVEHGAVRVTVGDGPSVNFGCGAALNAIGLLKLRGECEDFGSTSGVSPRSPRSPMPPSSPAKPRRTYEPCGAPAGAKVPALFEAQLLEHLLQGAGGLGGDGLSFYALCPQAAREAQEVERLELQAAGAPSGAVPRGRHNRVEFADGGVSVAVVTMDLVKEVAAGSFISDKAAWELKKAVATFEQNSREIRAVWRTLCLSCRAAFSFMPAEVAWAAAEIAERRQYQEGEVVVEEGEAGQDGESLFIIEEGTADVVKLEGMSLYHTKQTKVGVLGPGSVVGDLCFLGSRVPRPAGVCATSALKAVRFPAAGLLSIIQSFPGVLEGVQSELDQWASFLGQRPALDGEDGFQESSTREVLASCGVFAGCSTDFLEDLASSAEWLTLRCGEVLKMHESDLGSKDSVGVSKEKEQARRSSRGSDCRRCSRESDCGEMMKVTRLNSFFFNRQVTGSEASWSRVGSMVRVGSHANLGHANSGHANSGHAAVTEVLLSADFTGTVYAFTYGSCCVQTPGRGIVRELTAGQCIGQAEIADASRFEVCALTPIAQALVVRRAFLHRALRRHPDQVEVFQRKSAQVDRLAKSQVLMQADVFKKCGPAFIDAVCGAIEVKNFLPGQTLTVLGARDASQMFLLRSGHVAIERGGQQLATKSAGTAMGELMMLGIVASRSATIRAMTFCTVMEVPRAAFVAALESFPEERGSFEQLAMQNLEMRAIWPFLKDAPSRMQMFLNMHVAFKTMEPGDTTLKDAPFKDMAILLISGVATIVDPDGKEVQVLNQGESFNEQAVLGIPNYEGTYLVPKTLCEFQLLGEDVWARLVFEFPDDQESNRQRVLRHLCQRADARRGVDPSGLAALQGSGLFRKASEDLAALLCESLKGSIYTANQVIMEAGQAADYMMMLVQGNVFLEPNGDRPLRSTMEFSPGAVFGEAALVGAAETYPRRMQAYSEGPCLFRQLHRKDLNQILSSRPLDRSQFEALAWRRQRLSVEDCPELRFAPDVLVSRLQRANIFGGCTPAFVEMACQDADDVFRAPGEVIIESGETCELGTTPCYVVLAGQATVESSSGISLGTIFTGQLFGEAGALGLAASRTARVRASRVGLTHCAKIHGVCMKAALSHATQEEEECLYELFRKRQAENIATMRKRASWLEGVLPMVRASHLLKDWPQALLEAMVAPLQEAVYQPGDVISTVGEEANSMLVVLEGVVRMETATGELIGQLKEGASIGEVAALGLFESRTATARANSGPHAGACRVLAVPAAAMQAALVAPGAEAVRERLEKVVEDRNIQVMRGLPLSTLPISVPAEDITARAVALLAERIDLAQGEVWSPAADDSPCGQHFCVLVRGKACLEVAADSRLVMPVNPGSLIIEGQVAGYGAHVRALMDCEAYRVRKMDVAAVALSLKGTQDWYYRFRLFEKTAREEAQLKLSRALGCSQCCASHPNSPAIQSWKGNRAQCMQRAEEKRKVWNQELCSKHLPRVSSAPRRARRDKWRSQQRTSTTEEPRYTVEQRCATPPVSLGHSASAGGLAPGPLQVPSPEERQPGVAHRPRPASAGGLAPALAPVRPASAGGLPPAWPKAGTPELHEPPPMAAKPEKPEAVKPEAASSTATEAPQEPRPSTPQESRQLAFEPTQLPKESRHLALPESRQLAFETTQLPKDSRHLAPPEPRQLALESTQLSKASVRRPVGPGMVHIDGPALEQEVRRRSHRSTPIRRTSGGSRAYCW